MLSNDKKKLVDQIVSLFSADELMWTSGFLAGASGGNSGASDSQKVGGNITFLYVTETGNTKFIATEISKRLKSAGANVKVKSSAQYRLDDLAKEENIVFFVSTHGEGEMPAAGQKFFDHIKAEGNKFPKMNFGVIALGDSSYQFFCQAGKDVEKILLEKKAQTKFSRLDLDLDFENHIDEVHNRILSMLSVTGPSHTTTKISNFSAKKEFEGEVISNVNLNDIGSAKETHHIEISIPEDVAYEPGDAIAVVLGEKETGSKEKTSPRLYSISSSLNEHGNEVHLTVAIATYVDENGEKKKGLASGYLSGLKKGDKLELYISKNRQFKLPENDKDIIMVGPGTGVAPFRSFVAERNYQAAEGKNWLFFGEQKSYTDFLYQTEWQDYLSSGLLTKLDVAFSRDQAEKIYVQHKMLESSSELFKWLENGAYFYVCGDKKNMAADVEKALLEIISKEGNKNAEQAQQYLDSLSEEGRYLKDVY